MAILKRASPKTGRDSYQVLVDRPDPGTGKRGRVVVGTFRTRKEAERAEREAKVKQDRGTFVDPSAATISELLDDWLTAKAGTVSSNSLKDYEIAIRLHLKPALGHFKVQRVTADQIQKQYRLWSDAGMSPRMVHRCHLVLNQAFRQAVRFHFTLHNPIADVSKPRLERVGLHVWSAEDVHSFLTCTDADTLHPLWHLLVLEGMRKGEALGLRWQDVNWDRKTIHITQTVISDKAERGRATIQPRTKTRSSARTIRLTDETFEALRGHRDRQRFQRQTAGDTWQANDLIVCTGIGTPFNPTNVSRSFERLVKASGRSRIRVHDLRHTAATMLLLAGVSPKVVAERFGHSSVGITLDIYSHVLPDMQDDAVAAISGLLKNAASSLATS